MCCWNVATYEWKIHNGKIKIISFVVVSFLTATHCQFRGAGQGMKQTYPYLWYPLFQAQRDRCDQRIHQTYIELFSERTSSTKMYIAEREIKE
jgi:hypothetical protein